MHRSIIAESAVFVIYKLFAKMSMAPIVILKCRTCLGEFNEGTMHTLFEGFQAVEDDIDDNTEHNQDSRNNGTNAADRSLDKKIEYCCGVKIRQSAQMPSKICDRCNEFIEMWHKFRQMCLSAQVFLESSCLDSEKPDEFIDASDSEYMEYLYETLQTFPASNAAIQYQTAPADSDYGIECSDSQFVVETEFQNDDVVDSLVVRDTDENTKIKPTEMLITVLDQYEEDGEAVEPNYGDDSQSLDNSISVNDNQCEESANFANEDDENEDFLSPTPSPEAQLTATGKRKPGRPRKPDSELKSKRKTRVIDQQAKPTQSQEDAQTKYICNLCGNVYQKKSAFTAHMASHSDYKPHQCEICYKSFRQVGELRAHIRRHTGERPFKCLFCDRHFYDRSEKMRHERVHTNTRPYTCKECGKSFTHTAILKNHSLVHSGEKNYNCTVCSKSFTLLHQLKAHLQTLTHRSKEQRIQSLSNENRNQDTPASPSDYILG